MKFSIERLHDVREDIKPLIELHWEQIALNQGKIKLNPNWEEYERLDAAGVMKFFTARSEGELVGYFIITVGASMHYRDHLFAICDIIFVRPDKRSGATGYKLIKYAERWCVDNGVSLLNINTKVHLPFDRLMEGMGFDLIERVYSKYIGS
jgi:GNAT superfamily N-acetyltransferase